MFAAYSPMMQSYALLQGSSLLAYSLPFLELFSRLRLHKLDDVDLLLHPMADNMEILNLRNKFPRNPFRLGIYTTPFWVLFSKLK